MCQFSIISFKSHLLSKWESVFFFYILSPVSLPFLIFNYIFLPYKNTEYYVFLLPLFSSTKVEEIIHYYFSVNATIKHMNIHIYCELTYMWILTYVIVTLPVFSVIYLLDEDHLEAFITTSLYSTLWALAGSTLFSCSLVS